MAFNDTRVGESHESSEYRRDFAHAHHGSLEAVLCEAPWVAIELERHLETELYKRLVGSSLLPDGSPAQKSRFLHLQHK